MPDIPVRWDERVVRYLEFFRDDPRGHATFASLYRHSGAWRATVHKALQRKALPEDLVWVSMLESGFDAAARSPAGAVGLWQFTAETAKLYGLAVDRWIDQRLDPRVETDAAVDLLDALHTRFGSWEMALAGYDMGHAGLSSIVRRYNTNDFWTLSRAEGALPWETTLYVPKIVAAAVVANNLATFGFGDLPLDIPTPTDDVSAPAGTLLATIAQAAGCPLRDLQALNPELRAGRTPPWAEASAYPVKVPQGKGAAAAQALSRLRKDQVSFERYVVRFGETLDQIAAQRSTTAQRLVDLNAIMPGEVLRGGTVLLVPRTDATAPAVPSAPGRNGPSNSKPAVVVPPDIFIYPDRKRVFYRVRSGDTLNGISEALRVSAEELDRWNDLDPSARLQEGMTLQAFVDPAADVSGVAFLPESDVSVLAIGSDEFFSALERDKGFRRVTVTARNGETLEAIGRRFGVRPRTMERINRRGRDEALTAGQTVVVYVPSPNGGPRGRGIASVSADPASNDWSPSAAAVDLLP
jgi:membrane-bound lytic murein transglycosylase D